MVAVNLGRRSNISASWSFREFSNSGTSWRTKDGIKDWKYVVLDFNKKFWLTSFRLHDRRTDSLVQT